ncbi:MAG: BNR-4 repeat-containing protein [Verrucomicrobia bacterium]|nr:BNR-4 repeat-containing protein [Verrucomicrobiota bacterium]
MLNSDKLLSSLLGVVILLGCCVTIHAGAVKQVVLNDDGGWCWYEDERAIVVKNKLFLGTVANGAHDPSRKGDIDAITYDFKTGKITRDILHKNFEADDHDSPAFLQRADGRVLAMYCKHNPENKIYYRVTKAPGDGSEWQEEKVFVPSQSSRVTYSNLHWLQKENKGKGRIYNFFRGYDNTFKPSWMFSDDQGDTWTAGGVLIDFQDKIRHRPYVKYASNGKDTIHFVFTEAHPRNYDNSIYHAYYRNGSLHGSDGKLIRQLSESPFFPSEATQVFQGDSANVAWTQDMELDSKGHPQIVYSVQKDSAGLPSRQGGMDHRYRFARWDGKRWHDSEIAYAGSRLYAGEDDYTGGICIHPDDPKTVFISTNVDPVTGQKTGSGHYEIYRGNTRDGGATWKWSAITENSHQDNLRPIVPKWQKGKTALLWLRGSFSSYTKYTLEVVLQKD